MEDWMHTLNLRRLLALIGLIMMLAACQRQPEIVPTIRPTITPSPIPSATPEATEEATTEPTEPAADGAGAADEMITPEAEVSATPST